MTLKSGNNWADPGFTITSSMWTLLAFFCVYAGTSALGLSLQRGWVSTKGWRWIHHALFAIIWLTLGVALLWSFTHNEPWRWGLIAIAPFLILLPRFIPGSPKHCLTAAGGLAVATGVIGWAAVVR